VNILIAGVGGQGALLAARIIGAAAASKNFDVKVSEVHGMSQREGSVETYVRYAKEPISSPIIGKGGADVVLGFEALEALRGVPFLRKGGKMVMNTQRIDPMPVITGAAAYPEDIPARVRGLGIEVVAADALRAAKEVGNVKAVNVVMLGVLSGLPEFAGEFSAEDWTEAVKACVPGRFLEINLKAFGAGRGIGDAARGVNCGEAGFLPEKDGKA